MNIERNIHYNETKITYFLFTIYWFLSFFEGFISGSVGSISKYFVIAFILYLIVSAKKMTRNWKEGAFALWAVYYLASLMWSPNFEQGMVYVNSVIAMLILSIIFMGISFENEFVENNLRIVAFFSFLLGVLGLFLSESYLGRIASRQVLMLFGTQLDPNNMVALYAYGVGIGLYYIVNPQTFKIQRIYYCVGTLINIYDILMTGSRSGIIVILSLILIIFFGRSEKDTRKKILFKRIILIVLFGIVVCFIFNKMPQEVLMRITGKDANLAFSDSTGRSERWKYGMQFLWDKNPIFGCGWGAFECHGTFFTFLVDTGIVGAFLWGSVLASIFITSIKYKQINALLVFASGMVPACFIGAQNKRFFWNAVIISVMILNVTKEKKYEYD